MSITDGKKLLFVVNDEWFFTSHRLPIAVGALQNKFDVSLAARLDETNDIVKEHNISVHDWQLAPKSRSIFSDLSAISSLYSIVQRVNPDIVHLVTIKSILYGGIIARLRKTPCLVIAVSGMGDVFTNPSTVNKILRVCVLNIYKFILKHPNSHVIVQNEFDKKYFLGLLHNNPSRITKVPGSGVNLQEFHPTNLHLSNPVIMFASRLLFDKGVLDFIQTAKKLEQEFPKAKFVLVGSVDPENKRSIQEPELKKLIADSNIEWWGHKKNMASIIAQATAIVLPTKYGEGVPKVLIEACAAGKPVVSSKNPGCLEIIEDGINGYTVDLAKENGDDLTAKVRYLLENPDVCTKLGENTRKIAEKKWSVDAVVSATIKIYQELIDTTKN